MFETGKVLLEEREFKVIKDLCTKSKGLLPVCILVVLSSQASVTHIHNFVQYFHLRQVVSQVL